jgi:hypothetical protein
MESNFGRDFSQVRIHTDAQAAQSARAVNALAYTVGRDVVFDTGYYSPETLAGQRLLAHELTHVLQQKGTKPNWELCIGKSDDPSEKEAQDFAQAVEPAHSATIQGSTNGTLQRYEAGEHAQFGEVQLPLQRFVDDRSFQYKVKPGETLGKLAAKFGITEAELKLANQGKLKKWAGIGGGRRVIEGFLAGAIITIPAAINEATREALKARELSFVVNGVTMEYGVGIAMGDFFEDPTQMLTLDKAKLQTLADLVRKEKGGGKVTTDDWQKATNQNYLKLAEKNEAHFAPSDASLAPVSSASSGKENHKTLWEKYHKTALTTSQAGKKDEALRVNAFADHYLTDAFAAGHVINKIDVMEKFKGGLARDAKGEFIGDAKAFFDKVATTVFVGPVKAEFSAYESVKTYWGVHPNINSASRFSTLLQEIQKAEPDVLANAVAKAVHDSLNQIPGGLEVENNAGDKWQLSGDKTLNLKSTEVGRKAVARSLLNVLEVFKQLGSLNFAQFFKRVWDFVPRPTATGTKIAAQKVQEGTDPKQSSLVAAVVALINDNFRIIRAELVKRGFLRKA